MFLCFKIRRSHSILADPKASTAGHGGEASNEGFEYIPVFHWLGFEGLLDREKYKELANVHDELVENSVLERQVVVMKGARVEGVRLVWRRADGLNLGRNALDNNLQAAAGGVEPDLGAPCADSSAANVLVSVAEG